MKLIVAGYEIVVAPVSFLVLAAVGGFVVIWVALVAWLILRNVRPRRTSQAVHSSRRTDLGINRE